MWLTIDKGTGTCFYGMFWLFGTLVYMHAQLPRPGCSGEGLGLPTERGSFPSLKQGRIGRRVSGGAGGDWEEGRKCKYLNGKIKKMLNNFWREFLTNLH